MAFSARNLTEPSFGTDIPGGEPPPATDGAGRGRPCCPATGLVVAVDADLSTQSGVDGRWRALAGGAEVLDAPAPGGRAGRGVGADDRRGAPGRERRRHGGVGKGLSVDGRVTAGGAGADRRVERRRAVHVLTLVGYG